MNENEFRSRLDAELSQITWTPGNRRAALARMSRGGTMIMKRKVLISLMLAALTLLMALTAYAASVIFGPRVDIARTADRALEEQYGITDEMQVFFQRAVERMDGRSAVVTYTGNWDLNYVLGTYTVTIDGKQARAVWSHDGESTEGGLDAEAWGIDQLNEMIRLYRDTHDMSVYYEKAVAAAMKHHQKVENPTRRVEDAETEESFNARQAALREKSGLSEEELLSVARQAIETAYGLTAEQMDKLAHNSFLSWYHEIDGKLYYDACMVLIQRPSDDPNQYPEYVKMDGEYFVQIDAATGVVEDMTYDAALAGNG